MSLRRRRRRRSRLARWRPTRANLRRWRPWLYLAGGLLAVLAVLSIVVGLRMALVARDLRTARTLLQEAAALIEEGDLAAATERLDAASDELVSANGNLYSSPELGVIGLLPVAGENLDALRDTVTAALELVAGGSRLLELAQPLQDDEGRLQVPLSTGAIPLEPVEASARALLTLASDLPAPDERPAGGVLLGPVREAVDQVFDEIEEQRPRILNLGRALSLLDDLSGGNGDRRYLLAIANTAEMRGSGGMYLSYGVLESSEGAFRLRSVGSVDEIVLDDGVDPDAVGVPDDTRARWGADVTRLWRAVNVVPDLRSVGPWSATMYQAATQLGVDGVIQIDAAGLGAILEGIGPVDVEGLGQVTASNVVPLTLNEAYTLFPERDQRQEVLGIVAREAFGRLVSGDYPNLRPLAQALAVAVAERHIVMWTPHSAADGPLRFFGADGALPDPSRLDHSFLTVQNFSRNKLDYYVDTTVRVTGDRPAGDVGRLTYEVTIANTAPADGVAEYVFGGPDTGSNLDPGAYYGIASLYLPIGASLLDASGAVSREPELLREGGRTLIGWEVVLRPGETSTLRLEVELPPRPTQGYQVHLIPMPRVRPTVWDLDIDTGAGRIVRSGPLEVVEAVGPR